MSHLCSFRMCHTRNTMWRGKVSSTPKACLVWPRVIHARGLLSTPRSEKVAGNVQKCLRELLGARQILPNDPPVTSKNMDAIDVGNKLVAHFWRANPGQFSRVLKTQDDVAQVAADELASGA